MAKTETPQAAHQPLRLSHEEQDMLEGGQGAAAAMAMRILVRAAQVTRAPHFIAVSSAHIDGCLYHGRTSLDFVQRLVASGGKVCIPTTLNVGSLDLIHPELFRGDEHLRSEGRKLMEAHLNLGCEASFTCAPYQLKQRPRFGEQVAWAESNAIVFANSVLGARTARYGDFIDLCAALTGRAPYAGLHVTENRHGQIVFEVPGPSDVGIARDLYFSLIGLVVGLRAESRIPVLMGLPPDADEDELKALGAASASTGGVALFHAVGITPEAPSLSAALGPSATAPVQQITADELRAMRHKLSAAEQGDVVSAVSLGTPHFSVAEFAELDALLAQHAGPLVVDFYVNTSRYILWQLEQQGSRERLEARGVKVVVDTCTYLTPIIRDSTGLVMTNSGKMAHYAPSNLGLRIGYASLSDCVLSALSGRAVCDA